MSQYPGEGCAAMSQYIIPPGATLEYDGGILAPRLECKVGAATEALERLVRIVDRHGLTHYVRPSMVQHIYGRPEQEAKKYGPTAVALSIGSRGLVCIDGDWSADEVAQDLGLLEQKEVQP